MLIKVKAFPGSNNEEVVKKSEDSFDVKVKEKPIMGMSNKGIARALSSYFGVPESSVRLVKGFKERNKIFEIKKHV